MPTAAFLCQKESGNAFAGMVGRVTGKTAQTSTSASHLRTTATLMLSA